MDRFGSDGVGCAWVAREVINVPAVDPDDDSVWRWVLQHYRLDPQRKQRRNVIVAAYDNAAEFDAALGLRPESWTRLWLITPRWAA